MLLPRIAIYSWSLVMALCYLGANAMATSALPPPTNVRMTSYPQLNNEEQVFICPTDPNIVIANWRDFRLGYRQIGIGRSIDGGATWVDSLISPDMQYFNILTSQTSVNWQSDPTMTVDRLGNFYMSVLDFVPGSNDDSSIIAFYRSTDKGVSWNGPYPHISAIGPFFEDKQFTTVDRTGGTHDGNLYCSWTRFPNPDRIIVVRSTDGGTTFGDTTIVGPIQSSSGCGASIWDAGQFSIPIVNSDGSVHIFWQGTKLDSGAFCTGETTIKHVVSNDGGVSYSVEDNILGVSGYTSANGGFSTYSMPVGDADISSGPFDGRLYLAFTNMGDEDFAGHTDVDAIVSIDNGLTWSSRARINDESTSDDIDNFHPWLISNEDGVVIVVFYDQRNNGPTFTNFDLFAAYSFDGGSSYTTNHRISSASSNPSFLRASMLAPLFETHPDGHISAVPAEPMAGRLGEYIGVSANHDKILAVWTDTRDFNSEVYSASWQLPLLEPRQVAPIDGLLTNPSVTLQWATSWKHNEDRYLLEVSQSQTMSSPIVNTTLDTTFHAIGPLSGGTYYWRLKSKKTIGPDESPYSPIWSFTVDATPPTTPILLSPVDNSNTNNPTPTFDWSDATDPSNPILYDLTISTDPGFTPGPATTTYPNLSASTYSPTAELAPSALTYWRVAARDAFGNATTTGVFHVTFICGDADGSGDITIADAVFLISYIFLGGPAPIPLSAGDADGSGDITIADAVYLISYIFLGGPAPACP